MRERSRAGALRACAAALWCRRASRGALARLRAYRVASRRGLHRRLLVGQRGIARRAAALAQPLTHRLTLWLHTALHSWRYVALVAIRLGERERQIELMRRALVAEQARALGLREELERASVEWAARATYEPTALVGSSGRSTVDKLLAALDVFESSRLRPALRAWWDTAGRSQPKRTAQH